MFCESGQNKQALASVTLTRDPADYSKKAETPEIKNSKVRLRVCKKLW